MKSIKSFISCVIILAIFGAVVFYLGWTQFKVEPGECAVLQSKTSGVCSTPIQAGVFSWHAQLLLPTNATLTIFSLAPKTMIEEVSGSLPNAKLYEQQGENAYDFNYHVKLEISLNTTPQALVEFVKENAKFKQKDLDALLKQRATEIANIVTTFLLDNPKVVASSAIIAQTELLQKYSDIQVQSVVIKEATLPDKDLYESVKSSYLLYKEKLDAALEKQALEQAQKMGEDNRVLSRLTRLAQMLQEYPQLEALCKSGDIKSLVDVLEVLK